MRQAFRSPIAWIAIALLVLPAWFAVYIGQAWRYGLEALGFVLVVILTVRVNRAVLDPGATTQFPDVRYTCRLCGHQWTPEVPRTTLAHETGDQETADRIEPQQAKSDFRIEGKAKSQTSKRSAAISFLLAIFLNVPVILFIDWLGNGQVDGDYFVLCLPVSAVILGLGAGAGALLAKIFGRNPWRGATIGIWIGAIVSIAVLLGLFLLIGSGG
jgi:hypothetical protein